eukprot:TRINITY_DN29054_c0_g1_i1.p1 TRINITY_DN29054_c0_g1~~TRINITY_DN29054_c0_g1_i1.p1  ORF type:complete len:670 (-),score=119.11 TRINITY_DN29054_c0_g1_i1:316-2325(-)
MATELAGSSAAVLLPEAGASDAEEASARSFSQQRLRAPSAPLPSSSDARSAAPSATSSEQQPLRQRTQRAFSCSAAASHGPPRSPRVPRTVFESVAVHADDWWKRKAFSKTYWLSNYYYVFYVVYLILIMSIVTVAVYLSEGGKLKFLEAAYLAVSAGSMTGLSPCDFAATRKRTQVIVWLDIIFCSPMLLTVLPPMLRARSFRRQIRCEARAGTFIGAALAQGDLRSIELDALQAVRPLVLQYWFVSQLLGWLLMWPCLAFREGADSGFFGACWPALFITTSAFHNAGLVNAVRGLPFKDDPTWIELCVLTIVMLLILLGNSFFPIMLRLVVLAKSKIGQKRRETDRALRFLLEHPRKCYTHLFPDYATRWLAFISALLVLVQCMVLFAFDGDWPPRDRGDGGQPLKGLPWTHHKTAILFHSISTRTAGFAIMDLSQLQPCSAFVFALCMWLSISPVVLTMRRTAHDDSLERDESRSQHLIDLAVAASPAGTDATPAASDLDTYATPKPPRDPQGLGFQARTFMSENMVVLVVLLFGILYFEGHRHDRENLGLFLDAFFEFCSAWGTVGLSLSPKAWASSGEWSPGAQLCLMATMFLGRLRGLPDAIDPSVSLLDQARTSRGAEPQVQRMPTVRTQHSEPRRGEKDRTSSGVTAGTELASIESFRSAP